MNRTVLQIPINPTLRIAAEKTALDEGFSSLQEAVRVFLTQLARKTISISFSKKVILAPKAAARYNEMINELNSGHVKSQKFDNTDELMEYLNSDN